MTDLERAVVDAAMEWFEACNPQVEETAIPCHPAWAAMVTGLEALQQARDGQGMSNMINTDPDIPLPDVAIDGSWPTAGAEGVCPECGVSLEADAGQTCQNKDCPLDIFEGGEFYYLMPVQPTAAIARPLNQRGLDPVRIEPKPEQPPAGAEEVCPKCGDNGTILTLNPCAPGGKIPCPLCGTGKAGG